jgi:hypothetical protein
MDIDGIRVCVINSMVLSKTSFPTRDICYKTFKKEVEEDI